MRLGFGISGAHGTCLLPRAATLDLIGRALEGGIALFDTAPAYGAGEAERRLGAAVRRFGRSRFTLSTKAGLSSFGLSGRRRDFSPDGIERSIRASLARLGVDGLDHLFLHGAGPEELTPALFERLADLQRAGAYTALGIAGRGGELDAALETGRFALMMAPVHPFLSPAEEARLTTAKAAGVSVFAIETSGPGQPGVRLPRRAADLYHLAKMLKEPAGPRDPRRVDVGQGLVQALSRPEIDTVLFTTTRRRHLETNLALGAGRSAP